MGCKIFVSAVLQIVCSKNNAVNCADCPEFIRCPITGDCSNCGLQRAACMSHPMLLDYSQLMLLKSDPARLRQYRLSRTITIGNAARMLGISAAEYSKLERTPEQAQRLKKIQAAIEYIRKDAESKNTDIGTINCPQCGLRLHYQIHSNGHIHGQCSSRGCLTWM